MLSVVSGVGVGGKEPPAATDDRITGVILIGRRGVVPRLPKTIYRMSNTGIERILSRCHAYGYTFNISPFKSKPLTYRSDGSGFG